MCKRQGDFFGIKQVYWGLSVAAEARVVSVSWQTAPPIWYPFAHRVDWIAIEGQKGMSGPLTR
jgi:hypothetical protein